MNEGIVNNQGYYLQKSGERVSTLLSRQYIVPTLTSPPNENTLTWKDGDYIVDFRIGEFVRVILDDSYVFYRLNDIIENTASWELLSKADLSAYYNKEEVDGILHNLEEHTNIDELFTPIEQQLENKQDKIENLDGIIASIEQQIAEKQGSIEDLDVIRNGAEKGATALQSVPSEYATKTYVSNAITTSIINALNTPI